MIRRCQIVAVLLLSSTAVSADDWQTTAERTDYRETSTYAEAVDYCRRLAAATPLAKYTTFGKSPQGRDLPLLILSRDGAFTPEAARRSGKLVVLLQNCIHAGECAGKEASLALARDITLTRSHAGLLEHVTVLVMPIFSADGHERRGPYNRGNQNGPDEMGWRVTANNLNLNRDYLKADTVEMQHWLRLWKAWQPDFFFDNHTTDGSDHRYVLLYASAIHQDVDPAIAKWVTDTLYPVVTPAMGAAGHETMPYFGLTDRSDPSKGVHGPGGMPPRFSTGYAALCNRPSILLEAHALKPFKGRVRSTYEFMAQTLGELNRRPELLREAIKKADARAEALRGAGDDGRVTLTLKRTEDSTPFAFKGVKTTHRESDIMGSEVPVYGTAPVDVDVQYSDGHAVAKAINPPMVYLVPAEWHFVREKLELHGVRFSELESERVLPVETCRFEDVRFPAAPYEGRFRPKYSTIMETHQKRFPKGTLVVPLDQSGARIVVHLLEPDAPDSLVAWGFFNAIFEQKEYFESYSFEPIAREMAERDPALKAAFEEQLADDPEFAADPRARLNFFYRRSPYYDQRHNVYPIARLPKGLMTTD